MDEIFDFNKTYSGGLLINEIIVPCSLAFPDNHIVFSIVAPSIPSMKDQQSLRQLCGYIATEKGIKNFRAMDAFQTLHSSTWTTYKKAQFLANTLLVTHEKNDIHCDNFAEAFVSFNNLEHTGRYVDVDQSNTEDGKFTVSTLFETMTFLNGNVGLLELNNAFKRSFSSNKKTIFSITREPNFSYKPDFKTQVKDFQEELIRLGWFLELIFGVNQSITDLVFYETPVDDLPKSRGAFEYYFFHKDIIFQKTKFPVNVIHPVYNIEDLTEEIKYSYPIWYKFNKNQRLICRLYFNELNSKSYVVDDRFKNFCAIIQGLEVFIGKKAINLKGGAMYIKLRKALDETLEEILLSKNFDSNFIYQLFEIIGHQRDHYQHLNKVLKFDLNDQTDDMVAVNELLALIIKYHLLKAVQFPKEQVIKIIGHDIAWCSLQLNVIKQKFANKYSTHK